MQFYYTVIIYMFGHSCDHSQGLILFVYLFSLPWVWSREWPRHGGDCYVTKLYSYNKVHIFVLFIFPHGRLH